MLFGWYPQFWKYKEEFVEGSYLIYKEIKLAVIQITFSFIAFYFLLKLGKFSQLYAEAPTYWILWFFSAWFEEVASLSFPIIAMRVAAI